MHLRRLAMQYSIHETKELAVHLGMQFRTLDMLDDVFDTSVNEPVRVKFEILSRCIHSFCVTFNDIKRALESGEIQNPHTICKVLMGNSIDFDMEPEKWDLVPTEKHIDRIAPLVGNNSLLFLVELGMDFKSWEQIRYRQKERDLVKLNRDILQEWSFTFCNVHTIRPTMRHIVQALTNIGKNIKTIENALADLF
ncbi:uncharacterized protein [Mytilus edulis]|uniref:uncharacterized protein n=1 Tax=Mytilus edulis TaxID=6550 RepID=UPI0039EF8069